MQCEYQKFPKVKKVAASKPPPAARNSFSIGLRVSQGVYAAIRMLECLNDFEPVRRFAEFKRPLRSLLGNVCGLHDAHPLFDFRVNEPGEIGSRQPPGFYSLWGKLLACRWRRQEILHGGYQLSIRSLAAGMYRPNHAMASKPFTPNSSSVGT